MSKMLTKEQQKIVEQNHGLIFGFAKRHSLNLDEYYDVLAIGLCKAARSYDAERECTFATYAYCCMNNAIGSVKRIENSTKKIPRNLVASYNALVDGQDNHPSELEYFLRDHSSNTDNVISKIHVDQFRETLPDDMKYLFDRLMAGYLTREIAKDIGCTKQNVSLKTQKIKKRWLAYNAA